MEFLQKYSGESVDELLAYEGRYRIDSIVLAFESGLQAKAQVTDEERIVLAIEALEREVNNGGYDQFFLNTSNTFAPVLVDALERIGCPSCAGITSRAIDSLQTEDRDERLAACDLDYYANTENIEERLFAFIKLNRARFQLP